MRQATQQLYQITLSGRIEGRGRLIEHQDIRIHHQHSGQRHTTLLAAAQVIRGFMNRTRRADLFQSRAGALGVLFARSWERADGIYRAMLARGFSGRFSPLAPARFGARDFAFLCAAVAASTAIRLAL